MIKNVYFYLIQTEFFKGGLIENSALLGQISLKKVSFIAKNNSVDLKFGQDAQN